MAYEIEYLENVPLGYDRAQGWAHKYEHTWLRHNMVYGFDGSNVYTCGGASIDRLAGGLNHAHYTDSLRHYDITADTWTLVRDGDYSQFGIISAVGEAYANGSLWVPYYNDVREFNVSSGARTSHGWAFGSSMATNASTARVTTIGNVLYVVGNTSEGKFYAYDTSNPSSAAAELTDHPASEVHFLVNDETDVYLLGTDGTDRIVWKYDVSEDEWIEVANFGTSSWGGNHWVHDKSSTPWMTEGDIFILVELNKTSYIERYALATLEVLSANIEPIVNDAHISDYLSYEDGNPSDLNRLSTVIPTNGTAYVYGGYAWPEDEWTWANEYMRELTVNVRPSAPGAVTAPAETDIWGDTHTISWGAATSTDGDSLTYRIEISLDGGDSWQLVSDEVSNTEYEHDFSGYSQTQSAVIRVAAYDGWETGSWVESDTFSINAAPSAPSLDQRSNFDATSQARFRWTFNDPDAGDRQTAYELEIQRISDNVQVYSSGKVVSDTEYLDLPPSSLDNDVQHRWRVKTWDRYDVEGSWSSWQSFYTSAKPTVTITNPANNGDEVNGPTLLIDWAFSDPEGEPQRAYRLVLTNLTQGSTIFDTGKIMDSVNTQRQVESLEDSQDYRIAVTMWDAKDIQSDTAYRTFSTVFLPPVGGYVSAQNYGDHIAVFINNPVPEAGAADTAANDLYRREPGGEWIRIATNLSKDGYYDDYAVASGQRYEYYAIARSEEGLTAATSTDYATLNISGVWLHDPINPSGTIYKFEFDGAGRSEDWSPEVQMLNYSGRAMPVAEFGRQTDQTVSVTLQLANPGDEKAIRDLAMRRTTLCYRDGRGKKLFGVITALPISETKWGSTVELTVHGVSLNEEV